MSLPPPQPAARVPADGTLTVKTSPLPRWKPPDADSLRVAETDPSPYARHRHEAFSSEPPILSTFALLPCNSMLNPPDRPSWPTRDREMSPGRELLLFHRFDAHIRRRLRAIIVRQKKRSRHLYRHLVRRDVSAGAAAQTAYCRRGVWYQSNTRGMTAAYPNAWFYERLVSLKATWDQLNQPPKLASGQALLFVL